MKLKAWKLWLVASICFIALGMIYIMNKNLSVGLILIFLGGIYFLISIISKKSNNTSEENKVLDLVFSNMDDELRYLIAEGKKIQAIKKCRESTGLGLKEAKDYVERLDEIVIPNEGIEIATKNMDDELRNLIAEGKKIQAIKKYREFTGLGLKEAKDYVDRLDEIVGPNEGIKIATKNMDGELRNLIAEGKKIQAIKKYREFTGEGLKEAKDYVDNLSLVDE